MVQPPGCPREAFFIRPSSVPRYSMEERIFPTISSLISVFSIFRLSMVSVLPSSFVLQPSSSKISRETNTSVIWGTFSSTTSSPAKMDAARMGSTAFLLPLTVYSPPMVPPPVTR